AGVREKGAEEVRVERRLIEDVVTEPVAEGDLLSPLIVGSRIAHEYAEEWRVADLPHVNEPHGKRQHKDRGRGGPAELRVCSGGLDVIMSLRRSSVLPVARTLHVCELATRGLIAPKPRTRGLKIFVSYHRTCAPRPMMRPLRMPDGWLYVAGAVALAIE